MHSRPPETAGLPKAEAAPNRPPGAAVRRRQALPGERAGGREAGGGGGTTANVRLRRGNQWARVTSRAGEEPGRRWPLLSSCFPPSEERDGGGGGAAAPAAPGHLERGHRAAPRGGGRPAAPRRPGAARGPLRHRPAGGELAGPELPLRSGFRGSLDGRADGRARPAGPRPGVFHPHAGPPPPPLRQASPPALHPGCAEPVYPHRPARLLGELLHRDLARPPVGRLKLQGNKGGVSIRLSLYGHSVCFLNCHLPAHQENAKQRLDDFEHILEMQHFEEKFPSALDHELLFWFGDLNFRIEDYGLHFIRESISSSRFNLLWEKDQLNMAKKKTFFLQEFSEGPLKFKPTYKFDLHSDEYDTSEKKRKPAWTDRILWRVKCLPSSCSQLKEAPGKGGVSLSLGSYTSHMDYNISDHKPVTGTFELKMQPLQMEPLVVLYPVGTWSAEQDATVSYVAAPEFASSAWDWIGLYRVSFRHVNDYVTYVWVQDNEISSEDGAKQVYLGAEGLPRAGGEFLLGYYSNTLRSLVGLSQPVQVQPSLKSAEQQVGWASSAEHLPGERPPCDF